MVTVDTHTVPPIDHEMEVDDDEESVDEEASDAGDYEGEAITMDMIDAAQDTYEIENLLAKFLNNGNDSCCQGWGKPDRPLKLPELETLLTKWGTCEDASTVICSLDFREDPRKFHPIKATGHDGHLIAAVKKAAKEYGFKAYFFKACYTEDEYTGEWDSVKPLIDIHGNPFEFKGTGHYEDFGLDPAIRNYVEEHCEMATNSDDDEPTSTNQTYLFHWTLLVLCGPQAGRHFQTIDCPDAARAIIELQRGPLTIPESNRNEILTEVQHWLETFDWSTLKRPANNNDYKSSIPTFTGSEVLRILLDATSQWRDLASWIQALRACEVFSYIHRVSADVFIDGYRAFGFEGIKEPVQRIVAEGKSNHLRYDVIATLRNHVKDREDGCPDVLEWCQQQQDYILAHLQSVSPEDAPILATESLAKGTAFTEAMIIPQLLSLDCPTSFWVPFIKGLTSPTPDALSQSEPDEMNRLVRDLIPRVCAAVRPWPEDETTDKLAGYRSDWCDLFELCVDRNVSSAADIMVTKVKEALSATPAGLAIITEWLAPAVSSVSRILRDHDTPSTTATYSELGELTLRAIFDLLPNVDLSHPHLHWQPEAKILPSLMTVLRITRNITLFKNSLEPLIPQMGQSNGKVSSALIEQLHAESSQVVYTPSERAVLVTLSHLLLSDYISHLDVISSDTTVYDAIVLCYVVGANPHLSVLFDKIKSCQDTHDAEVTASHIIPYITGLAYFIRSEPPASPVEPLQVIVREIVGRWLSLIGPRPPNAVAEASIRALGCNSCPVCDELRELLMSTETQVTLNTNNTRRKHLEKYLPATEAWGVTWNVELPVPPKRLVKFVLTKPTAMVAPFYWRARTRSLAEFLSKLGTAEIQLNILGGAMDEVQALVKALESDTCLPPTNGVKRKAVANDQNPQTRKKRRG